MGRQSPMRMHLAVGQATRKSMVMSHVVRGRAQAPPSWTARLARRGAALSAPRPAAA